VYDFIHLPVSPALLEIARTGAASQCHDYDESPTQFAAGGHGMSRATALRCAERKRRSIWSSTLHQASPQICYKSAPGYTTNDSGGESFPPLAQVFLTPVRA